MFATVALETSRKPPRSWSRRRHPDPRRPARRLRRNAAQCRRRLPAPARQAGRPRPGRRRGRRRPLGRRARRRRQRLPAQERVRALEDQRRPCALSERSDETPAGRCRRPAACSSWRSPALLVGVGVWSALRLPIDAVPDVTNVQVQINTNAPALSPARGRAPDHAARSRWRCSGLPGRGGGPLALQVRPLAGDGRLRRGHVTSTSPASTCRSGCRRRASRSREGFGTPEMGPISTGLGEIFQYTHRGARRRPAPSCGRSRTGWWRRSSAACRAWRR